MPAVAVDAHRQRADRRRRRDHPHAVRVLRAGGLTDLMNSIQRIGQLLNPTLKIEGLLRTMYDPRISLTNDVSAQLQEHFGDTLYSTVIPRNVRLAEAPSFGMPALVYDKQSRGAIAYLALAGELVRRQRAKGRAATA
ncbi:ParA family protein [Pseudomonas aeruginosa]|uniref:ParA family protein n=1 Tax=Pseudomonas aeruginosa TaxID=287 RepID=UPI002FF59A24